MLSIPLQNWLVVLGLFSASAGLLQSVSTATELPKITPPAIAGGKQTIALPAKVEDLAIGSGGRYLALFFKSQNKIGIFDVNVLKIIGEVPAEAESRLAAGATKLLVLYPEKGTIVRYGLATQKDELSQPIDQADKVRTLVMGSASEGPAIINTMPADTSTSKWSEVDLATFKLTPLKVNGLQNRAFYGAHVRMSAEGNTLSAWSWNGSWQALVKQKNGWDFADHADRCAHVVPNYDGSLLYTGAGIFQPTGTAVFKSPTWGEKWEQCVPAVQGPYYFVVTGNFHEQTKSVELRLGRETKARDVLENLERVLDENDEWAREPLTLEKRFVCIPPARLILQLSKAHDALIAVPYDVEAALRKSREPYLYVTSRPPRAVNAGEKLAYPLTAISGAGEVQYKLDAAPTGMQISPTGLLTWSPTAQSPATNQIIVAVRDKANQLTYQSFGLDVVGGEANAAAPAAPLATGTPNKPLPVTPTEGKQEHRVVELPGRIADVACGGNGRFLLLHFPEQKQLGVFDVSLARLVGYLPADANVNFAAGATRVLVADVKKGEISRYRLDTLERESTAALPFGNAPLLQIVQGAGIEGPALLLTEGGTKTWPKIDFHFLDPATLKPLPAIWPDKTGSLGQRERGFVYAAANCPVFSVTRSGAMRVSGNDIEYVGFKVLNKIVGGYPAAGANFYLAEGRLLDGDQKPLGELDLKRSQTDLPAVTGNYYLSFSQFNLNPPQDVTLHAFGVQQPLATIKNLRFEFSMHASQAMKAVDKRIFLIPAAHAIVTIPGTSDRIEIRRVNIDDVVSNAGFDFLFVESTPPFQALLGKAFSYDVKVKSKKGGVTYKLTTGPPGMEISNAGKLTWPVPASTAETNHQVAVTVSDASGQSQVQAFQLDLPEVKLRNSLAKQQSEDERKLALEEVRKKLLQPQPAALPPGKDLQPLRPWKDATGMFTINARFMEIADKKTVVLQLESGEFRRLPLGKLADEDIYEAVRLDLQQRQNPPPKPGSTPFDN